LIHLLLSSCFNVPMNYLRTTTLLCSLVAVPLCTAFTISSISSTRILTHGNSLRAENNEEENDVPGDLDSVLSSARAVVNEATVGIPTTTISRTPPKEDNKAMAFLRKMGKVGGAANKNFVNAVGADEGAVGKVAPATGGGMAGLKKAKAAYQECTTTGIIDDLTESFPLTSSGTQWRGISDRIMGGLSNGIIQRHENIQGRVCNLLTGTVSLANNGGFIQMATDLSLDPSKSLTVDASEYEGIELDVLCNLEGDSATTKSAAQSYNVHLRSSECLQQQSSYRYTFTLEKEKEWVTIKIPFSDFVGHGPGASDLPLNVGALKRIGIVAIGREMEVFLSVSGLRFYKKTRTQGEL